MQLKDPCLDRDTAKETMTQFRVYVADWKFLETQTRIFSNTFKATSPMHNTKVEQIMKMAEESHHELSEMRAIAVEDLSQVIHTSNRGGRQGGAVWRTEHGSLEPLLARHGTSSGVAACILKYLNISSFLRVQPKHIRREYIEIVQCTGTALVTPSNFFEQRCS